MKIKILLACFYFMSLTGFAQKKQPTASIKAGIVSSGMNGETLTGLNDLLGFTNGLLTRQNNTGFFAGFSGDIPLGEIFSFEPGFFYSVKGTQINGRLNGKAGDLINPSVKAVFSSNYIDLPLLIKADMQGFQIFAGPQVSYLTHAELKTSAGLLGINLLNHVIDATSVLNRWDAGVTGGIGYRFQNGLILSASFEQGLLKADKNRTTSAYNQAFKVGVGFSF